MNEQETKAYAIQPVETEECAVNNKPNGSAADESRMTIEQIIDQYGDGVLRLCLLYLGDRQLAEDAFQITMTKAWTQLHTFRGESSMKTWIMRIAVNACRDMLRSGWFRMMRRSEPEEKLFDTAAPDDGEARELRAMVLSLPGKYREVIVLYYYEDMKVREIAQLLGMPAASVSSRLRRARAMLKIGLEGGADE